MRLNWLILGLIPLALALDAPPALRLLPVDPAGPCAAPALALNTNTAAVSRCVDGKWTVATPGTGVPMVAALPPSCTLAAIPPLVLLSGRHPALYACTARNTWTPAGPSCYRADHYPSLAAAVAAAGNNSVILLPDGYQAALDSPLLLPGQGRDPPLRARRAGGETIQR